MSPATALGWFRADLEAIGLVKRLVDDEPTECPKVAAARGKAAGEAARKSSEATHARARVVRREGVGHD